MDKVPKLTDNGIALAKDFGAWLQNNTWIHHETFERLSIDDLFEVYIKEYNDYISDLRVLGFDIVIDRMMENGEIKLQSPSDPGNDVEGFE